MLTCWSAGGWKSLTAAAALLAGGWKIDRCPCGGGTERPLQTIEG